MPLYTLRVRRTRVTPLTDLLGDEREEMEHLAGMLRERCSEAKILPSTVAQAPNVPHSEQTLEQLRAEREYWDRKISDAASWGGDVGPAAEFRSACDGWILRRATS